jgi:hypothetical protein
MPVGLYNSTIISSDFGDNVAIDRVNLLSHYQIGNEVMILQVNELATTATAKFGNGNVKDGEEERIRIWMELGNENAGRKVVPFVGMMFSHAALEKIVGIVSRDDLFCELRLGTAIRKLKLKFKRLPLKARATICWHPYPFQINNPGLFHGIKSLSHNSGKEKQPGKIAALFYDLKRSFNRQRILKQNRPQQ